MTSRWLSLLVLLVAVACFGCQKSGSPAADAGAGEQADDAFKLGSLLEPFDPPTLEELEKKVEWIDQPVLDSLELLRQRQEKEPVLATVEEALQLRNTSKENNEKILSALGRAAPADGTGADFEETIVRHIGGDVRSTNPMMISSSAEFDIEGLTGVGFFGFDWSFRRFALKESVVSWQSSKDGMYDKLVMRDDMTWADGEPITAHDVEFSFKVIMSEKVPVPAVRSGTDQLKAVKAYDDHTVVFFHKEPLATNQWNVSFPIIAEHKYEKSIHEDPTLQRSPYHVELDADPVVGGAYVITKRVRGQEIVLQRRESYYMHKGKQVRTKPYWKEVRMKVIPDPNTMLLVLKRGEIDEAMISPVQWVNRTTGDDFYANNTKAYGLEWVYFYFGWNCKSPYFSDKRVRQAMAYAYDHDQMIEVIREGLDEKCTGIYHHTSRWAPTKEDREAFLKERKYKFSGEYKSSQDYDKAEALLEEAGWVDHDRDGIRDKEIEGRYVPFQFTIITSQTPGSIRVCKLLSRNLDRIGIICNVRPMEYTVLQDRSRRHRFHAMFGGWGTGVYPDTSENIWKSGAGRNYVNYADERADEIFKKASRELDEDKRRQMFAELHMILWEDQPYTWLFFRNSYYGFNKRLRGYVFSPRGPYHYGPGFSSIYKALPP